MTLEEMMWYFIGMAVGFLLSIPILVTLTKMFVG